MRKMILAAILCLLLFPRQAYAEPEYMDYSQSLSDYAQAVAILNQSAPAFQDLPEVEAAGVTLSALLCRTDGTRVDFTHTGAVYVLAGPDCCFTLFFEEETLRDAAVELLNRTPGIRYAEADCEVQACELEEESSFLSWGAEEMSFGPYVPYANANGNGSAVVAVIDSGCYPHSMLVDRILLGGMDYVDGDWDVTNDGFGHGTNVAGIIVDCTPGSPVNLFPIRVLNDKGGGKMSNVVNAVREATSKATVINMSLESATMSAALDDAIRNAVASGTIVVAAAGNHNKDTSEVCPAHLTDAGVIVVGAATGTLDAPAKAYYSNFGASVDVYAFGSSIQCCSKSGGYTHNSGTSMAAPHISGVCALMQVLHPGIGPVEAEYRLRLAAENRALPIPDLMAMIPTRLDFSLSEITLQVGDLLILPPVQPQTACEELTLTSSDESVVSAQGDTLTVLAAGIADITCTCPGLETVTFRVTVLDGEIEVLLLPESVTALEEEAFLGDASILCVLIPESTQTIGARAFDDCPSLKLVYIPSSVTEFAENTFSDAVILCQQGSPAHAYAAENALAYIAFEG